MLLPIRNGPELHIPMQHLMSVEEFLFLCPRGSFYPVLVGGGNYTVEIY